MRIFAHMWDKRSTCAKLMEYEMMKDIRDSDDFIIQLFALLLVSNSKYIKWKQSNETAENVTKNLKTVCWRECGPLSQGFFFGLIQIAPEHGRVANENHSNQFVRRYFRLPIVWPVNDKVRFCLNNNDLLVNQRHLSEIINNNFFFCILTNMSSVCHSVDYQLDARS